MPEITQPASIDPKGTAANIVQGIHDRAAGRSAAAPPVPSGKEQKGETPADPNAGKERLVIEGKEMWLSPEQIRAYAQKGLAFEPKMDQLNRLQRETAEFLNDLKSNPAKILFDKRLGHTPESVFENIMASSQISDSIKEKIGKWYYENAVLPVKSPQEFEQMQKDKKLSDYEQREKAREEASAREADAAKVRQAISSLKANIAEAMKDSGLPSNDTALGAEMARMVADVMRLAAREQRSVTPKQAIEHVKKRMREVQAAYYDSLDDETLVKELGEKNAEKVKKYFLKLVKSVESTPTVSSTHKNRKGEREIITPDEMHDYLAERKRNGAGRG